MPGKNSASAISCTLSPEELRRRREELLPGLLKRARQMMDLENGLRFRFDASPGLLVELTHIIEQERVCCSFLSFQISIEPAGGAITMEVTGPAGTREMLRALMYRHLA